MMKIKLYEENFKYVLKCENDIPDDQKTIWHIKTPTLKVKIKYSLSLLSSSPVPISSKDSKDIDDEGARSFNLSKADYKEYLETRVEILVSSIISIDNLFDTDDNIITWPDSTAEREVLLSMFNDSIIDELFDVIVSKISLGENEVKN